LPDSAEKEKPEADVSEVKCMIDDLKATVALELSDPFKEVNDYRSQLKKSKSNSSQRKKLRLWPRWTV